MLSNDFGFKTMLGWINQPNKKIGIVTRNVNDWVQFIRSFLTGRSYTYNMVYKRITFDDNDTIIEFFEMDEKDPYKVISELRGPQFHCLWGIDVPAEVKSYCIICVRLGDVPVYLLTK